MLQLLVIVSALVALSVLLLGINIFVFGRKFPETEVGKNKHMIRLGLRCPQCEERKLNQKSFRFKMNGKSLKPDWSILKA